MKWKAKKVKVAYRVLHHCGSTVDIFEHIHMTFWNMLIKYAIHRLSWAASKILGSFFHIYIYSKHSMCSLSIYFIRNQNKMIILNLEIWTFNIGEIHWNYLDAYELCDVIERHWHRRYCKDYRIQKFVNNTSIHWFLLTDPWWGL